MYCAPQLVSLLFLGCIQLLLTHVDVDHHVLTVLSFILARCAHVDPTSALFSRDPWAPLITRSFPLELFFSPSLALSQRRSHRVHPFSPCPSRFFQQLLGFALDDHHGVASLLFHVMPALHKDNPRV